MAGWMHIWGAQSSELVGCRLLLFVPIVRICANRDDVTPPSKALWPPCFYRTSGDPGGTGIRVWQNPFGCPGRDVSFIL